MSSFSPTFRCAGVCVAGLAAVLSCNAQAEAELLAKSRLFPEVTGGVTSIHAHGEGPARRYYVLSPHLGGGSVVQVFNAAGARVAQIPALPAGALPGVKSAGANGSTRSAGPAAGAAALQFPADFDVDDAGRVFVADRGADSIKIFSAAGALEQTISVLAPSSIVALPGGEAAVTSVKTPKLVTVFDLARGKPAREFGETVEISSRPELNRFLQSGRITGDGDGHIFYAFSFFPEPTVRKYDRFGYVKVEIELATLEFQPAAQAARREIARLEERGREPSLKQSVTAVGVDPQTGEVWAAVGGVLLHLSAEGHRLAAYRTYTADGARMEASAILVEPARLLIASDTLGVFEFPRPDKKSPAP